MGVWSHMYGTYHLTYSPDDHVAAWGARLLYGEVKDGGSGLVSDRQTGMGDESIVEQRIFPHVDAFMVLVRKEIAEHRFDSSSKIAFHWSPPDDPAIHFAASPQGSYGYIYLTAVADKSAAVVGAV